MAETQDPKDKWKPEPRKIAHPPKGTKDITPEMRAMVQAVTHPDGDPYDNARKMGFYCEQCG